MTSEVIDARRRADLVPRLSLLMDGNLDAHHNRVRFSWELGPECEPPLAGGVHFGVMSSGRLQSITEFLDFVPGGDGELRNW